MDVDQTFDEGLARPGDILSPGPLKMPDLEASALEGSQLPPRKLEPITSPVVAKKRKRAKKKDKPAITAVEGHAIPATDTATQGMPTLLGESMLNRLRSRLDPLYDASPPPLSESSSLPPLRLPPLGHSTRGSPFPSLSIEERDSEQGRVRQQGTSVQDRDQIDGAMSQRGSRRRTRKEKNVPQGPYPGQPSDTRDGATAGGEDLAGQQREELRSTSRDALIISETVGGSEKKKRRKKERERSRRTSGRSVNEDVPDAGEETVAEVRGLDSGVDDAPPPATSEGRRSRGRQLPAPPSFDGEDTLVPPISTMADELATTGGLPTMRGDFIHPDDPQFLVSEDDIVEVEPDELERTTRTFPPVPHPHTSASQPKDVIFVERKDGRGFAAQRKNARPAGRVELERNVFGGEVEISSSQFAIYSHQVIQHLAIIAHGLVAGISLWDCVVSNSLSRGGSGLHLDLLTHYHPLTLPANSTYAFLLSIVLLSLLDRFDLATLNKEFLQGFFKTPVQIVLLIASSLVFFALILTLSVVALDERISLYPHQPSLWVDILIPINTTATPIPATPLPTTHTSTSLSVVYIPSSNLVSSRVTPWLALAIVRSICCSVSWILVVSTSKFDRLLDYLKCIEEESCGAPPPNKQILISNSNSTQ